MLEEARQRFGNIDAEVQRAVLAQWNDLFRTGYMAWGTDLRNASPPFCHVTERGRIALRQLSRDPSNPEGYKAHLVTLGTVDPIAQSYLDEGLECFIAGLYKASAVMIGCAAERIVLEIRDELKTKLTSLSRTIPSSLNDWKVKTVLDALKGFFDNNKASFTPNLRADYESYWSAFNQMIRSCRNDAGHPNSISPITFEAAHASFLVFPEQFRLANELKTWVNGMT